VTASLGRLGSAAPECRRSGAISFLEEMAGMNALDDACLLLRDDELYWTQGWTDGLGPRVAQIENN
jgi:hypothetical protein